jgi:hypothetical protein
MNTAGTWYVYIPAFAGTTERHIADSILSPQ